MKIKRIFAMLLACVWMLYIPFAAEAAAKPEQPYPDSSFFAYGDYQIHYRVQLPDGESRGRILLLHGFFCSTYAWRNMARALCADGYTCVLADLPDFGYSTRETDDVAPVDREDLMIALMRHLAPDDDWILAGHSMGGGVAINIAEQIPLRALLLYCPCPQSTFPPFVQTLCATRFMQSCTDAFLRYGTRITPLVRLTIFAATNDLPFARGYDVHGVTDPIQTGDFGAGLCGMMRRVRKTDLAHADAVICPVLLVEGDRDLILPSSIRRKVRDALPQAETVTVEGGGHQCIENRAEEIAAATSAFLQNCE